MSVASRVTDASARPLWRAAPVLLGGGLAIGTLDLLFVWGFWAPRGASLTGILQSVAAGWYGLASQTMGSISAIVGALSHYAIATWFVVAYWLMACRFVRLRQHPLGYGLAYGLLLYVVMNAVVLPLSAAGAPPLDNRPWIASSVLVHAALGVICALCALRAMLEPVRD